MKSSSLAPALPQTPAAFTFQFGLNALAEAPEEFMSVKKNGLAWAGVPEMHLNKATSTLTLLGIANRPADEEVLILKLKFDGPGTYSLTKQQAYYYTTAKGHVLTSAYELASCAAGVLEISGYDPAEMLLEGSFRMVLTKEQGGPETNAEALSFTEGRFRGRVAI